MKLVYLEWEDAVSSAGWCDAEEVELFAKDKSIIKQTGWIYKETKKYIILVGRLDEKSPLPYGLIQKIPRTWIRKRIMLKL